MNNILEVFDELDKINESYTNKSFIQDLEDTYAEDIAETGDPEYDNDDFNSEQYNNLIDNLVEIAKYADEQFDNLSHTIVNKIEQMRGKVSYKKIIDKLIAEAAAEDLTESTNKLETFEELNKLEEANSSVYWATKMFWDSAKNAKLIDVKNFHIAYDNELKQLGLDTEFDTDGKVKSKSSYGVFKKAAEEHPDSFAVKAALKFAGLQFWDNAKTVDEYNKEKETERIEEKKALYNQKVSKLLSMESEFISAAKEALDKIDFTALSDYVNEFLKLNAELENTTYVPATIDKSKYDVAYTINYYADREPTTENFRDVEFNFKYLDDNLKDIDLNFSARPEHFTGKYFSWDLLPVEDINKDFIYKEVYKTLRAKIIDLRDWVKSIKVQPVQTELNLRASREAEIQKAEQEKLKRQAINQLIKTAVNSDTQPGQEVLDKLDEIIEATREDMKSEARIWAGSQDGSLELSIHMALYKGVELLDACLTGCYWESDVSTFKPGQSNEDYEQALVNLINKSTDHTIITFIKG